jgi:serine/threonine protein kinase
MDNILKIYGISQNPITKDYIMVLEYAEGGNLKNYLNMNYKNFDWLNGLKVLTNIIRGLNGIHQKQMVHRDFHTGNILFLNNDDFSPLFPSLQLVPKDNNYNACISDMGLCRKIDDIDEKNIYGVMPYVAPEVLRRKPYTQAADIYSFGMIMYVIATGKQPFSDDAHDGILALKICNGIRPEINEKIAPKCYIDLMKKCWDSNPDNRPNSIEIKNNIELFCYSLLLLDSEHATGVSIINEIQEQFNETQDYRKEILLSIKNHQLTTHAQAIYTSRLLNPYTKNLPKYDNNDDNSVEITDFTMI